MGFVALRLPLQGDIKMLGVTLIDLPKFTDTRGCLVAIEGGKYLPFEARRVFFMWDVPASAVRAEDAISCHEALIALQGEMTLDLDNGTEQMSICLARPDQALCMHAGVWVRMRDFSNGAIVLVVASQKHSETKRFLAPQPELIKTNQNEIWR